MKVGLPDFIKLFLIQYASIPKTVCLCIKLLLEIVGQHHLNFFGVTLTIIHRKQLEKMKLSWV